MVQLQLRMARPLGRTSPTLGLLQGEESRPGNWKHRAFFISVPL